MKDIRIGLDDDCGLSCGCDSSEYPFGKVMFGSVWNGIKFYRITEELSDTDIYLSRSSEEGIELQNILDAELDVIEIDKLALKIIIREDGFLENVKTNIERIKSESFEVGRRFAKQEIREVLGL